MTCTLPEKCARIRESCLTSTSADVYDIFQALTTLDCVGMHGPEHHIIDGACVLTAYRNAGGPLDLAPALDALILQGLKMPGAMCGQWGVCGAVTSVGAALALIDGTGPLSTADWGDHMAVTSGIVAEMAKIGGPRCCKRDGLLALQKAAEWLREHRRVPVACSQPRCRWFSGNAQCLRERCPWYPREDE